MPLRFQNRELLHGHSWFAGSAGITPAECRLWRHSRLNESQTLPFQETHAAFVFLCRRNAGAPGKLEIKIIHCHDLDAEN
jgi:hypothetical protein